MRYIRAFFHNGYCNGGEDGEEYYGYDDETTDEEIEEELDSELHDFAESYCNGVEGYSSSDGWESEEDEQDYYDGCSFSWIEISQEEYEEREDF